MHSQTPRVVGSSARGCARAKDSTSTRRRNRRATSEARRPCRSPPGPAEAWEIARDSSRWRPRQAPGCTDVRPLRTTPARHQMPPAAHRSRSPVPCACRTRASVLSDPEAANNSPPAGQQQSAARPVRAARRRDADLRRRRDAAVRHAPLDVTGVEIVGDDFRPRWTDRRQIRAREHEVVGRCEAHGPFQQRIVGFPREPRGFVGRDDRGAARCAMCPAR